MNGKGRLEMLAFYLIFVNVLIFFSLFLYICPIPKVSSRFRDASALPFSNSTFYRGLNSGLSCTCTDSRIFNAPNFAQNTFLCKSAVQVDRTPMSFFSFGKLLFSQKSLCWERKWLGELKIRTWQTLLLSNFPRIANSLWTWLWTFYEMTYLHLCGLDNGPCL